MYTFVGELVLDPFLGSGTTAKAALNLQRNVVGYEINEAFLEVIKNKLGLKDRLFQVNDVEFVRRTNKVEVEEVDYTPQIKDAVPKADPGKFNFKNGRFYRVVDVVDEQTLCLDTGLRVKFLGVVVEKKQEALEYLKNYLLGKEVFLRFDNGTVVNGNTVEAYVYLKNKIFVNAYLIKSGLARAEKDRRHRYWARFVELEKGAG